MRLLLLLILLAVTNAINAQAWSTGTYTDSIDLSIRLDTTIECRISFVVAYTKDKQFENSLRAMFRGDMMVQADTTVIASQATVLIKIKFLFRDKKLENVAMRYLDWYFTRPRDLNDLILN